MTYPRPRPPLRGSFRHGRRPRGPLQWPAAPSFGVGRVERIDAVVRDVWRGLRRTRLDVARQCVVEIERVPRPEMAPTYPFGVPLAAASDAENHLTCITLYERPITARVEEGLPLALLVRTLLIEQIAEAFALDPTELDPQYQAWKD